MHIAHTEASHGWGGQEIRILTEIQGMLSRGYKVTLLTPCKAQIFNAAKRIGIETVDMPYEKRTWKAIFCTRHWLKLNTPDVINTHSSIDSWVVGIARIGLKSKPAIIRTRHISAPISKDFTSRWLYRKAADHVVTTGKNLRHYILNRLNIPNNHITSIPTGINLNLYNKKNTKTKEQIRKEIGIPENTIIVGIAATLRSWKGHIYLLEAFKNLAIKHPNLCLLIAGDGPGKSIIETWVKESDLSTKIHLIGHRDDVPDVLAAMDIFALPSYANEGVPQAILQAMAMKLPIVSTNVGAIEEAVKHEKNGFIIKPKNVNSLAQAIDKLITNPDLRKTFGEEGRKITKQQFSIDKMIDEMENVFQNTVTSNRLNV